MKFLCPYCYRYENTSRSGYGKNHTCSQCNKQIPFGYAELQNPFIALVGSRGSGKTIYITTLIEELMTRVCTVSGLRGHCDCCGDETRERFRKARKALYEDGILPSATRGREQNARDLLPLIFRMSTKSYVPGFYPIPRTRSLHLVFFDAAGEDLEDEEQIARNYRHFRHAAGIIFLIDPLQIQNIAKVFQGTGQDNLGAVGEDRDIMGRFVAQYKMMSGLGATAQIKVPTALVITKSDLLSGEPVGLSERLLRNAEHFRGYDRADQRRVSSEVRAQFQKWHPSSFSLATTEFADCDFFAVSSLGGRPEAEGRKKDGPNPWRVEDPLLWILWRLGYVPDSVDMVGLR